MYYIHSIPAKMRKIIKSVIIYPKQDFKKLCVPVLYSVCQGKIIAFYFKETANKRCNILHSFIYMYRPK